MKSPSKPLPSSGAYGVGAPAYLKKKAEKRCRYDQIEAVGDLSEA